VSLSLIAAAFSLAVIIMLLYLYVEKFRGFVEGHKGDTIGSIVDRVRLLITHPFGVPFLTMYCQLDKSKKNNSSNTSMTAIHQG